MTYLTKHPWSLRLEFANWKKHGKQLLVIEKRCFDEQMRSHDDDLQGLIKDKSTLAMVLFDGRTMVGYIAGVPLESDSSSFDSSTDPSDGWGEFDTLYIDNVSILPEHRNQDNFKFMLAEYLRYSIAAGYRRATAHARISNGLSAYCVRKLKFNRLRTICNWYECGEDFDYIAITAEELDNEHPLSVWQKLVKPLRRLLAGSAVERYFR